MLRWLFVVTVVFMALNVSSATACASDTQASVTTHDTAEFTYHDQNDFDEFPPQASPNSQANNHYKHYQKVAYLLNLTPVSIQPIRAPPSVR